MELEFHHFISLSLRLFVFCVLLCRWCSSSSLHPTFFSSQIAQRRWFSSSSLHPVFFSSQITYPTSLRSFFKSSVGSSLHLQIFCGFFSSSQIFVFFFSFFFFLGSFFLLVLSSFSGFVHFFFLCLKLSVKNSRFMFFLTRLFKTRDLCGIIMSNSANSASGKRVFEARD